MHDLDSIIAFYTMSLAKFTAITKTTIADLVRSGPFALSDGEKDQLIRRLEASFDISQAAGASVKSDYRPWLKQRKPEIEFFYWERLKRYYLQKGILPPQVVATLDTVTDEVLDYSGNPAVQESWARRGMVMGHVQSGKTTNYSALICKAADAGYKIIILLAGITNSLRRQTQERLDETFIGKKSVFQKVAQEPLSIVRFADRKRFPAYGTSRDRDFSKVAAATYGVGLSALKEPIIFVTKKNKTTLERLRDWLREQNHGQSIQDPLLLIDDEADNASINTAADPQRVTAINRAIREILGLFDRSTYVGYTATPFANIFIDPDTEHEMLDDDLFPQHFIKALDPPTNYVGAARIFQETGDLKSVMVRPIDDYGDLLPLNHKRGLQLDGLPASLLQAIRVFVLTRAIRIVNGDGRKHCSMMVNVSRFNDIQERVQGLVYEYIETLRNSITVNAGLGDRGLRDPDFADLSRDFAREFASLDIPFSDVRRSLVEAISTIEVRTVNMRGGSLDYSQHADTGLHVVAVGGLALSRGLTLEGLTVSYILRNASASDTLMQMARWFGYRPRYENICRLYLPQRSYDHYEYITEAIEELRSEVQRMEQLRMTPSDFGLRVRHSPAAIRITAANKMRSASAMTVAQDYSGRHIEGYALVNDDNINRENLERVKALLAQLHGGEAPGEPLIWRKVDGAGVFKLLREFRFSHLHPDLGRIDNRTSLFQDYVYDRLGAELATWDVALPASQSGKPQPGILKDQQILLRERNAGRVKDGTYRITAKNKAANPGDEQIGLDDEALAEARKIGGPFGRACCLVRPRPLLLVHLFTAQSEGGLKIRDPVVTLSFCLPSTVVTPVARQYQVNAVYRKQMLELAAEPDDDEGLLDQEAEDA